MPCSVIIVTYNSEKYIDHCITALLKQTVLPEKIILVDTGSENLAYLSKYTKNPLITLVQTPKNSGFCAGNNIGYQHIAETSQFVLLLNPDAFLHHQALAKAHQFFQKPENSAYSSATGCSFGFNIETKLPTKTYDSTGIFRTWYGKWYDRGQGKKTDKNLYCDIEEIPAICGALFFIRKDALKQVLIEGKHLFNPTFFMYKEDIELSLRLRNKGGKLAYVPEIKALHCRGWNSNRKLMPKPFRLQSAKNELHIAMQTHHPIAIVYSTLKYLGVKWLNL